MTSIQQSLNNLTNSFAQLAYRSGIAKSMGLAKEKKEAAQAKAVQVEETEKKRQGYLAEIQQSQEAYAARVSELEEAFKGDKRLGKKTIESYQKELAGMLEGERTTAEILRKEYKTNPYASDPRQEPDARLAAQYQRFMDLNLAKRNLKGGKP